MDSVIVHFKESSFEDIEHLYFSLAADSDPDQSVLAKSVVLMRCNEDGNFSELDEDEKKTLFSILGGSPKSSFVVAVRHGQNAIYALRLVIYFFNKCGVGVIDDDYGGLHTHATTIKFYESHKNAEIYALRNIRS